MTLATLLHLMGSAGIRWCGEGYAAATVEDVRCIAWERGGETTVCAVAVVLNPLPGEAPRAFMVVDREVPPADRLVLQRELGVLAVETVYVPPNGGGEERTKHG